MRHRLGHPLPILAGLVLAVAALTWTAVPVSAHARPAASEPANGAALDEMPSTATLTFTEPVAAGSARSSVDSTLAGPTTPVAGEVTVDGETVRLGIVGGSPAPQTVTVAWRVVSATDGHETTGLLIFSVGTGIPPRIDAASTDENPAWRSVALRAAGLLGLVLQAAAIAGGWLGGHRTSRRLALGGAALAVVGFSVDAVDRDLLGRQSGQLLLGAVVMAGLVVAAIWVRRPAAAAASWLLAVAAVVAGGHAAGDQHRLLATLIGATHAALGLAWAGVIVALAMTARGRNSSDALRRIGPAALIGVVLLALAGVALTALRVDGVRSLGDLTYGRLVLAKQALLAAAVATAAVNRLVLLPRASEPPWGAIGRPVLAFEALVLAGAVAVAGALSNTPPADGPRAVPVASRAIAIEQQVDAGSLVLRVRAAILGVEDDELSVTVARRDGQPLGEIQRLIVATSVTRPGESTPTGVGRVDAAAVATTARDATYAVPASGLAVAGVWTVELTVRQAGLTDEVGSVTIDSTAWEFLTPRLVEDAWRWPHVPPAVPVLLLTAAVVLAVGFRGVCGSRTIEPLPAVIVLAAIVAITAGFTVQAAQQIDPAPSGAGATPPDGAIDLVAAADDYRTYCLACHGVGGGGVDDTDPVHDHGSGTDLLDTDTRDRSDGDLFALTSGGLSGTTMPAYDVALTDGERWALVAYLRTLQQNRPDPTAAP